MQKKSLSLIFIGLMVLCIINLMGSAEILSIHRFKVLGEDLSNMKHDNMNCLRVTAASTEMKNIDYKSSKLSAPPSYTINEICEASQRVKNYIESHHQLPNYVDINSRHVTMPEYLFISTTAVKQIKTGSSSPVTLRAVNNPANPSETVRVGNIYIQMSMLIWLGGLLTL